MSWKSEPKDHSKEKNMRLQNLLQTEKVKRRKHWKKKKKERESIMGTDNANIVVNADAEEVIVDNQHGEDSKNQDDIKFQYITGSLENTILKNSEINIVLKSQGIREHACEILEGGTEAFKKRENKYAIA